MAHTHAIGISVRHAVSRALATANMALADATFRIVDARVKLDPRQRVRRGEASLHICTATPIEDWSTDTLLGVVNPDGEHPLMSWVPGNPGVFMDIFPVTWDRWLRQVDDRLPPDLDPLCPRTGVGFEQVQSFAQRLGKRIPSVTEFTAAWGALPFPWGENTDPRLGRLGPPRYGELPEVGLHPPSEHGFFDLGAWLWQWVNDGQVAGGDASTDGPAFTQPKPQQQQIGMRLVQDP